MKFKEAMRYVREGLVISLKYNNTSMLYVYMKNNVLMECFKDNFNFNICNLGLKTRKYIPNKEEANEYEWDVYEGVN